MADMASYFLLLALFDIHLELLLLGQVNISKAVMPDLTRALACPSGYSPE
jgi:hypothetical protein